MDEQLEKFFIGLRNLIDGILAEPTPVMKTLVKEDQIHKADAKPTEVVDVIVRGTSKSGLALKLYFPKFDKEAWIPLSTIHNDWAPIDQVQRLIVDVWVLKSKEVL